MEVGLSLDPQPPQALSITTFDSLLHLGGRGMPAGNIPATCHSPIAFRERRLNNEEMFAQRRAATLARQKIAFVS